MTRGQPAPGGLGFLFKRAAQFVVVCLPLTVGMPGARAQTPATPPLAEVNGDTITLKDLEQAAGAKLSQLEEQLYEFKRRELDVLIADRLFAQEAVKRGVSVSALLDTEITAKVALVTEQEIPWDQLAFAMVRKTLEHFLEDRRRGVFVPRVGDIRPPHR